MKTLAIIILTLMSLTAHADLMTAKAAHSKALRASSIARDKAIKELTEQLWSSIAVSITYGEFDCYGWNDVLNEKDCRRIATKFAREGYKTEVVGAGSGCGVRLWW